MQIYRPMDKESWIGKTEMGRKQELLPDDDRRKAAHLLEFLNVDV